MVLLVLLINAILLFLILTLVFIPIGFLFPCSDADYWLDQGLLLCSAFEQCTKLK